MFNNLKVAWLFPSLDRGEYWIPILKYFISYNPKTKIFTSKISSTIYNKLKNNIIIKGKTRFLILKGKKSKIERTIVFPSLSIFFPLIKFKPKIVFTSSFSYWTMFVIILKSVFFWKVIIVYDGTSPSVEKGNSRFFLLYRKFIGRFCDGIITNTNSAELMLVKKLKLKKSKIFVFPYEVPDKNALLKYDNNIQKYNIFSDKKRPIFLYVGRLIKQKGLKQLIEAAFELKKEGINQFSIIIVGDGNDRNEFEELILKYNLQKNVFILKWIAYNNLGFIYSNSDVLVFPSYEDVWGMVVLEAMLFNIPILCSKYAGVNEMIKDGINGFIFDPYNVEELKSLMKLFINDNTLLNKMGKDAGEIMKNINIENAVNNLNQIIRNILTN